MVPVADVESAFQLVIEALQTKMDEYELDDEAFGKIEELCVYFEHNYVDRRPPLFPNELWNHHDDALNGLSKTTTTAVEGF